MADALPQPELPQTPETPALKVKDDHLKEIDRRRRIVDEWQNQCADYAAKGKTRGAATEDFLEKHPDLTARQLYRWAARRRASDPSAILDGRRRSKRKRCPAEDPSMSKQAWAMFTSLWMTIERRSVAACYLIVGEQAQQRGWTWPSVWTVRRRIKTDLKKDGVVYYREGERQWKRKCEPKIPRDYSQYRSGQVYVGDFHIADTFCRKSDTNPKIVRPLVSAFQDLRSRCLVAHHIVEREDQNGVLLAFRDAVIKWGVPSEAVIDNGKSYRARGVSGGRPGRRVDDQAYVRSVMGQLNVEVHFSNPYNPDSKPIERTFRTIEEQFGAFTPGYCSGDNKSETFKAAHRLAVEHPGQLLTVAQYGEKLAEYVEAYHNQPHSGEGMNGLSPAEAFKRFDPVPRVVAPAGVLDLLLMRVTRPVKVTRLGVRHGGVDYGMWDERLRQLEGREVLLRLDPENAGKVLVCDLDGLPLCWAINHRLLLTGTTRDDLAQAMRNKNHAKRIAKEARNGATEPILQSVTDAAISARLKRGREDVEQQLQATGTEDPAPRNIRPMGGEFAKAVQKLNKQADPPPPADPDDEIDFAMAADLMEEAFPDKPAEEEFDWVEESNRYFDECDRQERARDPLTLDFEAATDLIEVPRPKPDEEDPVLTWMREEEAAEAAEAAKAPVAGKDAPTLAHIQELMND